MDKIKFLYIVLCFIFLGISCSKGDTDNPDPLVDRIWNDIKAEYLHNKNVWDLAPDRIVYPVPFSIELIKRFEISDETIAVMSTRGLLDSYLNYPQRVTGPWCFLCSNNLSSAHLANRCFNWTENGEGKLFLEMVLREDYTRILIERYVQMVYTKNVYYYGNDDKDFHGNVGVLKCFEVLIAEESFLKKLTKSELKNFMTMALKMVKIRNKDSNGSFESWHLITSILFVSKFEPFIEEIVVGSKYEIHDVFGIYYFIPHDNRVDVEKYARQFLIDF